MWSRSAACAPGRRLHKASLFKNPVFQRPEAYRQRQRKSLGFDEKIPERDSRSGTNTAGVRRGEEDKNERRSTFCKFSGLSSVRLPTLGTQFSVNDPRILLVCREYLLAIKDRVSYRILVGNQYADPAQHRSLPGKFGATSNHSNIERGKIHMGLLAGLVEGEPPGFAAGYLLPVVVGTTAQGIYAPEGTGARGVGAGVIELVVRGPGKSFHEGSVAKG